MVRDIIRTVTCGATAANHADSRCFACLSDVFQGTLKKYVSNSKVALILYIDISRAVLTLR